MSNKYSISVIKTKTMRSSSTHKITTETLSSAHRTTTMTTFTETPILIGFKTTIGKNP